MPQSVCMRKDNGADSNQAPAKPATPASTPPATCSAEYFPSGTTARTVGPTTNRSPEQHPPTSKPTVSQILPRTATWTSAFQSNPPSSKSSVHPGDVVRRGSVQDECQHAKKSPRYRSKSAPPLGQLWCRTRHMARADHPTSRMTLVEGIDAHWQSWQTLE